MSFMQRVENVLTWGLLKGVQYKLFNENAENLRKKLNIQPTQEESDARVGIYMVPTVFGIEFARPIVPAVKMIGPVLPRAGSPLPDELESIVSSATEGVVLFSLGTMGTLTESQQERVFEAFGRIAPVKVLFKSTGDFNSKNLPDNVKVFPWLPQNDLLAHPNVKVFVSHGGINGINEAAYHGVPVLGFPLFADQWDNIARARYGGWALEVDTRAFTSDDFVNNFQALMTEPSFQANATRISRIVKATDGAKEALKWIEYALAFGDDHFVMHGSGMPWYQRNLLDVFAFLFFVTITIFGIIWQIIRACCCRSTDATKAKAH